MLYSRLTLKNKTDSLLIVQCDCGDQNADLIACARYSMQGELTETSEKQTRQVFVIFIIQLPREAGHNFKGFQVIQQKQNYNTYR